MAQASVVSLRPRLSGHQTGVVWGYLPERKAWVIQQDGSKWGVFAGNHTMVRSDVPKLATGLRVEFEVKFGPGGELWATQLWLISDPVCFDYRSDDEVPALMRPGKSRAEEADFLSRMHFGHLWFDTIERRGGIEVAGVDREVFVSEQAFLRSGQPPDVSVKDKLVYVEVKKRPGGGYEAHKIIMLS